MSIKSLFHYALHKTPDFTFSSNLLYVQWNRSRSRFLARIEQLKCARVVMAPPLFARGAPDAKAFFLAVSYRSPQIQLHRFHS